MKLYIWQNNPGNKWYIHYDFDHPLGRQLRAVTRNLFQRTTLNLEGIDKTATFRINPHNGLGELFTDMTFYQFLLIRDYRGESKENCILYSDNTWLVKHPNLKEQAIHRW